MNQVRQTLRLSLTLAALLAGEGDFAAVRADEPFPVEIAVQTTERIGPLRPIWRFFGADEPNYVYMKDGVKLVKELGELRPGEVYFRAHNLLTSGDGTPALKWGSTNAFTLDDAGRPVYDWTITDRIFDTLIARGVKPYVEVGFMPEALSQRPEPYRHEWRPGLPYGEIMTGWRYPPRDYSMWEELVFQFASHCAERYGAAEAASWYWETWNEANSLPNGYWGGTREEFFTLHDHTIAAVRRALPDARVGGPHSAGDGGDFTRAFLEHCLREENSATGDVGTPLDFISFHAKGAPHWEGDHIRMGIAAHLATIDRGFRIVASFPELRKTPIVIGESDPEGCAACQGSMFSYRNGSVYSSYTAASFARKYELADRHGVHLEGALTWAFEFEDQPYFAGFRQLASNSIPLPVLNVFRMFSQMSGDRVAVHSTAQADLDAILRSGVRDKPDVGCLASVGKDRLWLLLWHYHDDDVEGPDASVAIRLDGDASYRLVSHQTIDEQHSNSYAAWRRMGSPLAPSKEQFERLKSAAQLEEVELPELQPDSDGTTVTTKLPRQAVSLIEFVKLSSENTTPR
ncbi:Beta-xylosidase [Botrimarina colliarenosi]|uniref:Beta-xylosidase n=1 Tax=Botrimarina colliarenosi TaxID=2528001 RepID=A0A5C6A0F2_9BACT|nr:beta-xylosidase [Botrimarina colliarenosi]TWT92896.1 Beta-xylosidase [Botrimarina colliarenosi]